MPKIFSLLFCTILVLRSRRNRKTGELRKMNKRAMRKKSRSRKKLHPRNRRRRKRMMTRDPKLLPCKISLSRKSFLKSIIKVS